MVFSGLLRGAVYFVPARNSPITPFSLTPTCIISSGEILSLFSMLLIGIYSSRQLLSFFGYSIMR